MPDTPAMSALEFDADAYTAALTPPVFVHGGRRYVGRLLSADEQVRHAVALARLDTITDDAPASDVLSIIRAFVDAVFPDPAAPAPRLAWWRRAWRWMRRRPAPAPLMVGDLFMALPLDAQLAGVRSFAVALAMTTPTPGPNVPTVGAPNPAAAAPASATGTPSRSRGSSTATGGKRSTTPRGGRRATE